MPDGEHHPERRKHPRLERRFICRYRLYQQGTGTTGGWQLSTTKNIGLGGCYITTSEPYEPGSVLELELQMPQVGGVVKIMGEVNRCETGKSGPQMKIFGLGIAFLKVDETKKEQFAEVLAALIERQNRN
ncbi:MAG: hypothetical protein COV74_08130 [Candidatus Omnitrophica bacterium CG11_big_fil_rev_8_21_14_0_20_45_26]|uniref:PilZ domain-containing protein n=1 Tax=Candidatus Abzuiibacterium crystallinum TaxID=1974748 RepID=A0A2H0LMU3_9BACT|nr:MAG: hypothetical protein COV74_08130 [Candidatus Omnitrophica bacterium CG11_big_fil_rev_8_21_14_0_20_45_26]PIW65187.1 MAG: hypothetical protein COW12_03170 [Candidatus Omnitrophica bacterium CG12_big_fil_rev_8_21_14_0_65_45_16]